MFDLKSNKTLGIILTVLVLVVLYIYVGDNGRKERTFRKELVTIDTSAVSEIYIYPKSQKGKEVKLFKENGDWNVLLAGNQTASVPKSKVEALLSSLIKIKPNRLVAKTKEKWGEYQVGENATRVKVIENGKETLNIILGKFSFQQPRQVNSYVRLSDDMEVYEVEGFLEMSFNHDANYFRDNTILKENYKDWKSLKFDYPENSFTLTKINGKWIVDGIPADSAETDKYLRSIARLTSTNFIDTVNNFEPSRILTIERNDSTFCKITASALDSLWVIHSSENSQSYFDGNKNDLYKKIFIDKKKFLK